MDAEGLSEKELLDTCIQGCKESWDTFVRKYANLIHYIIKKVLNTHKLDPHYQDIHDIHNNLYLSLIEDNYKKLRQYDGRNACTVSSWLMVVTSNFVLNLIQTQKCHNNATENVYKIEWLLDLQPQPEELLLEKEHEGLFKELICDLNAKDIRARYKTNALACYKTSAISIAENTNEVHRISS